MRSVFYWGAGVAAIFVACATSTSPSDGTSNDEDAGNTPVYDAGNNNPQGEGGAGPCTLGSADHCGSCDTVCPGPPDDAGTTTRVCSDSTPTATCDIICNGEWYDLNGTISDGCEGQDPIVHDNADAAVPETATAAGFTVPAPDWYLYGDARMHDAPPATRPTGREDWYVVSNPDGTPKACLSIVGFPTDDIFEVCITNVGNKNIENTQCKTITSTTGAADCVQPSMTGTGKYWVRVRKMSGSNTADGYALFIQD